MTSNTMHFDTRIKNVSHACDTSVKRVWHACILVSLTSVYTVEYKRRPSKINHARKK